MSNSVIRNAIGTVLDVQSVVEESMRQIKYPLRAKFQVMSEMAGVAMDTDALENLIQVTMTGLATMLSNQQRFVCISSTGGLVQDVWTKDTLEEARMSLGVHCHGNFDGAEDDARVFERLDDGTGVEVYSYNASQFICKGKTEAGEPILEFDPDAVDPDEDDDKYRRCTQNDDCNCYTCEE